MEIIVKANIDENADYFMKWKADDISMRDFIYTGIAGNWIDVTKLNASLQLTGRLHYRAFKRRQRIL